MGVPNLVRMLFGERLSSQGKKILRYATDLGHDLKGYYEREFPPHYLVWFDSRSEPVASALYLKLRLRDPRVKHGPFASTYTTDCDGNVVVGVDIEPNPQNEDRLKSMVPSLRKKGALSILYAAVHPIIKLNDLNGRPQEDEKPKP